jgi:flagellar assembly protein FliH
MSDKVSTPNWQRLRLADFGKPAETPRSSSAVAQKKNQAADTKKEYEQTQGFLRGYDDGLVAGRFEGFAAGEAAGAAEGRQAAHQLLSLAANLDKALTGVDQEIADEILTLSLEIARQVLRQTVAVKPEVVLSVVHEALALLPHQHAAIYLNPADAALVRKHAGDQLTHAGHHLREDPRLERNDVVIEANGAQVDATMATRWRRIIETLGSKTPWSDDEKS